MDVNGITSMLNQTGMTNATTGANTAKTDSLKNSVNGLSSNSSDEELMEVLKDFESYFVEQIIKKMKETFTDEDEESSMASQYTDTFMDYAIEEVADKLLDEVGGSMTQQLFEQMKRNYNIPVVEEV
jgi:flagellar protein FlgJ